MIIVRRCRWYLGFVAILSGAAGARADLLYATGEPGIADAGGYLLREDQFYGARFRVTAPTEITSVGGHLWASEPNSGLFAAIVRLDSGQSLPKGSPFGAGEVLASGAYALQSGPSREYDFPLAVSLVPGDYGLVLGDGRFGDPVGGYGAVSTSISDAPDSSYFLWAGPILDFWSENVWPPDVGTRLTLSGSGAISAIPEPGISAIFWIGGSVLFWLRRSSRCRG
ncbi:MAG: hypothetical protein JNL97_08975 [Verrucomicrobiales bacterium]|nr:hypothetical protein [Verrucomicrobiales bacterium]